MDGYPEDEAMLAEADAAANNEDAYNAPGEPLNIGKNFFVLIKYDSKYESSGATIYMILYNFI